MTKEDKIITDFFKKFCINNCYKSSTEKFWKLSNVKITRLRGWINKEMKVKLPLKIIGDFLESRNFCMNKDESYNLRPWKDFLDSWEVENE